MINVQTYVSKNKKERKIQTGTFKVYYLGNKLTKAEYVEDGKTKSVSFNDGHASHVAVSRGFSRAAAKAAAKAMGRAVGKMVTKVAPIVGTAYSIYETYKYVMKPERTASGTISPNSAAARRFKKASRAYGRARAVQSQARAVQKRARAMSRGKVSVGSWRGFKASFRGLANKFSSLAKATYSLGKIKIPSLHLGNFNGRMRSLNRGLARVDAQLARNNISLIKNMKIVTKDATLAGKYGSAVSRSLGKSERSGSLYAVGNMASIVTTKTPTVQKSRFNASTSTLTIYGRTLSKAKVEVTGYSDKTVAADSKGHFRITINTHGMSEVVLTATGVDSKKATYFASKQVEVTINTNGTVSVGKVNDYVKPKALATPFPKVNPVGVGKGIVVTGKTLPHAKIVVTLPNGSPRTGIADAKGIFRIPVGLVNVADNLEIFVIGQNTKSKSYSKSRTGDVPHATLTQKEKEDAFLKGAQNIRPQDLADNLPENWTGQKIQHDGKTWIKIRDGAGNIRMRIDPPDLRKSKRSTDNYHMHKYNGSGKTLDVNNKVVDSKSKAAHIFYDWAKEIAKMVFPEGEVYRK